MKKLIFAFLLVFSWSTTYGQTQTPAQVYLAYREAFAKATSLEALQPFLSASLVAKVSATPQAERPKLLGTLKMLADVYQVHVTGETDLPDTHILIVDGVDGADKPMRGTVELVKEPSGWKLVKESWHGR